MELGPNQRRWVDDLKSGNYRKATGMLRSCSGGFCCLGVYVEGAPDVSFDSHSFYLRDGRTYSSVLANRDWRDLGLHDSEGYFFLSGKRTPALVDGREYASLVELNDYGPFDNHIQMGEFIEKHADVIFTEAK